MAVDGMENKLFPAVGRRSPVASFAFVPAPVLMPAVNTVWILLVVFLLSIS
jgi:hypothetical protein